MLGNYGGDGYPCDRQRQDGATEQGYRAARMWAFHAEYEEHAGRHNQDPLPDAPSDNPSVHRSAWRAAAKTTAETIGAVRTYAEAHSYPANAAQQRRHQAARYRWYHHC